jgi:hypothetical protein
MEAELLWYYNVCTCVSSWMSNLFIALCRVTLHSVISHTKMNFTAFRAVMISAATLHNRKNPGSVEQADMLK